MADLAFSKGVRVLEEEKDAAADIHGIGAQQSLFQLLFLATRKTFMLVSSCARCPGLIQVEAQSLVLPTAGSHLALIALCA